MNFTAVDFETANSQRVSACAVGAAVVRDGDVVEVFSKLIRPPTLHFDKRNIAKHGIHPDHVRDAPTFVEVWRDLQRMIGDAPIAMHNARFDLGVLLANFDAGGITLPDLTYFCTLELARMVLPGLPNHKLPTLATVFGIPLKHHDPASDALACARLGVRLMRLLEPAEFDGHVRHIATLEAFQADALRLGGASVSITLGDTETDRWEEDRYDVFMADVAAPDGRFEGLRFVFTGKLAFLTQSQATQVVEFQGGKEMRAVSGKTNYVVVGDAEWAKYECGHKPTEKLAKALDLQKAGAKIQIIREPQFLALCGNREGMVGIAESESMLEDEEANRRHLGDI